MTLSTSIVAPAPRHPTTDHDVSRRIHSFINQQTNAPVATLLILHLRSVHRMEDEIAKHCESIIHVLQHDPPASSNLVLHCFPLESFEQVSAAAPDVFRTVKLVHFVRHGQGEHNAAQERAGYPCGCALDPPRCPYLDVALIDARLTERGRREASELQHKTKALAVDRIIVSPLSRAIETAQLGFAGVDAPTQCFEVFREQMGRHVPDQRRATSELVRDFPHVDFSRLEHESDELWKPERETKRALIDRARSGIELLESLAERHVALVGHSSWLLACFGAVLQCHTSFDAFRNNEQPISVSTPGWADRYWFHTAELRSLVIAYQERPSTTTL